VTRLTIEEISRLPLPGADLPGSVAFTPGGDSLTYLRSSDGSLVRSLWRHDLATGERHILAGPPPEASSEGSLGHEEELRRERSRTSALGVTEYAWATDAAEPTLMVPIAGTVFVAVGDETMTGVRPLPGVENVSAASVAQDGRNVAFVRSGELWVAPIDGFPPRQLTEDAEPGVVNGLAEYVAAEELDRFEGLWWSADGRQIAYAHFDERMVPLFPIAHLGDEAPAHEEHRYPFAGGPNALVTLRVVATGGGPSVEVELGMAPDDYLARVVADPTGGWLAAVLPRAQRSLRWLRVNPDGSARELWVETAEPWVNLDDDTRVLADGRVLRSTERTGYRHLELRHPDGSLDRQLTDGDWVVTGVAHVDEARQEVLIAATRDGVTERHLYAVSLDAAAPIRDPERLTSEPGWHEVAVSRDGGRWADTWSTLEHAPRVVVRSRDGAETIGVHEPAATAVSLGLVPPELLELTAADGITRLHAALYRPAPAAASPVSGSKPPPVVVWVYGGPHSQYVTRAWEATVQLLCQYLAQRGAAVLVVDNRGTANRGIGFESVLDGRLGRAEVNDQAAAVRQLAERGEIDPERVAITGGSYGGLMTLLAMADRPELFGTGVAVSPVTAWDGYDTAYTERYLGRPDSNPDGYRQSSPITHAGELRGRLLLIHGAIDENVHLRHSIRLLAALQEAGRDVGLVVLPQDRHRTRSHAGLLTRDRRAVAHLLAGLGLPPAAEMDAEAEGRDGTASGSPV
jgi:dipeptidyl-peptidase-4